ncbi:MAG: hypothetical protein JSV96_15055 [Candidatus Aminicenantes bacterium]|nr:MAG: hypothetical protein JSV96_15055 [Candidatus Aminicenantes bacterium]
MKVKNKIKILSVALSFLFLGLHSFSYAQSLSFHVKGGRAFPKEESIKSGTETGFGFSYLIDKKISISFDFSYWKSEVIQEPQRLYDGKLSITPFLVSLEYSLLREAAVIPYVFAGGGIVFSSFEMDDIITIPEITISQKIENGITFHCGTGGRIKLMSNLALLGEIIYIYREADGETTITDLNFGVTTENFSIDMSSFIFRVGVKYYL